MKLTGWISADAVTHMLHAPTSLKRTLAAWQALPSSSKHHATLNVWECYGTPMTQCWSRCPVCMMVLLTDWVNDCVYREHCAHHCGCDQCLAERMGWDRPEVEASIPQWGED